jgi:hypothetical protein
MAFHYSPKIVTDGLVLYLDAGNTKSFLVGNTNWFDLSGKYNNGTLKNTATYSSVNGGTITFDGFDFTTGGYIDLGTPTSLDLSSDISVSVWHKLINTPGQAPYDTLYANGSDTQGRGGVYYYSGTNKYSWSQNGGDAGMKSTSLTYSVGEWRNITVTRSGITGNWTIIFYINGILDSSQTTTSNPGTNQATAIGRYGGYDGNHFSGNISNVKVYKRSLSSIEVLRNYNALKSRFGL